MGETVETTFDMDAARPDQSAPEGATPPETTPPPESTPPPGEPQIPEKFGGDLAKFVEAYGQLEARLSQQQQEPAPDTEGGPLSINPEDSATPAADPSGVDWAAVRTEYLREGDLSQETRAGLEKIMPKEVVNQHMEGLEAIRQRDEARIFEVAGGKESWNRIAAWARGNLSEDQLAGFNASATSGNGHQVENAVRGLMQMYSSSPAAGQQDFVDGQSDTGGPAPGFSSQAEMTRAIADPRYEVDPAYRQEVQAKIAGMGEGTGLRSMIL